VVPKSDSGSYRLDIICYFLNRCGSWVKAIQIGDLPLFIAMADAWVRRKLSLITQSQILENVAIDVMKKVAATFGIQLEISSVGGHDVLVLPQNKEELKKYFAFWTKTIISLPC
jgi:hypothetical protein